MLLHFARAAHRSGDLDEAQRLYREVVAGDPRLVDAWGRLSRVALAREDWPEAVRAGLAALEIQPDDEKLYLLLPEAIAKAGHVASDRSRIDAVAWANAPSKAYLLLALMHLDAGDRARADRPLAAAAEAQEPPCPGTGPGCLGGRARGARLDDVHAEIFPT